MTGMLVPLLPPGRYEVRSPHRIALVFEEAQVGGIRISEGLEALLAPAMLPRGSLQHQLLLAIKEVGGPGGCVTWWSCAPQRGSLVALPSGRNMII